MEKETGIEKSRITQIDKCMNRILRVAITGPESTGKSMLAEQLAQYYHTVWVPEFARTYLETLGRSYEEIDILTIAKGQVAATQKMMSLARQVLFCDTELIVTKIWSNVKYRRCDPWILEGIERQEFDLYLLCDIDLPWEYDPLREHPHMRRDLFNLYFKELTLRKLPFAVIQGIGPARLGNAVNELKQFNLSEDEQ